MPAYPIILHHGGKEGVTGSCHELRVCEEAGILIDCGLFQGAEEQQGPGSVQVWRPETGRLSRSAIEFPVDHLKALVLTHVHIDHAGRIPWLLATGFRKPIYCSQPSAALLPLMLEDAFKVGVSRDRHLVETYLEELKTLLVPLPYGKWHAIPAGPAAELAIKLL